MKKITEGATVALTRCPAIGTGTVDHGVEEISGLFILVEFLPFEPSNYVWSPTWVVMSARTAYEGAFEAPTWDVDAHVLFEQVDPQGYGRMLVQEREQRLAEEFATA
jgi:hypothetical protein